MDTFSFDRKFEQYNLQNKVGLAVLVIQNGETLFKKGYGLRNLETAEPVTTETNFRLASVSKQFHKPLHFLILRNGTTVQQIINLPLQFPIYKTQKLLLLHGINLCALPYTH